jgi:hypothetical protein
LVHPPADTKEVVFIYFCLLDWNPSVWPIDLIPGAGLRLDDLFLTPSTVVALLVSTSPTAACTRCRTLSDRVHSHYRRTVAVRERASDPAHPPPDGGASGFRSLLHFVFSTTSMTGHGFQKKSRFFGLFG